MPDLVLKSVDKVDLLPFDQRLQFHLSHQVDPASPEELTKKFSHSIKETVVKKKKKTFFRPADQLGQEVQGNPSILHLLFVQTDPADLSDQVHHLHPTQK